MVVRFGNKYPESLGNPRLSKVHIVVRHLVGFLRSRPILQNDDKGLDPLVPLEGLFVVQTVEKEAEGARFFALW